MTADLNWTVIWMIADLFELLFYGLCRFGYVNLAQWGFTVISLYVASSYPWRIGRCHLRSIIRNSPHMNDLPNEANVVDSWTVISLVEINVTIEPVSTVVSIHIIILSLEMLSFTPIFGAHTYHSVLTSSMVRIQYLDGATLATGLCGHVLHCG